jgi:hypothetical protein
LFRIRTLLPRSSSWLILGVSPASGCLKTHLLRIGILLLLAATSAVGADTNSVVDKLDRGIRGWQSFWGVDGRPTGYQLDLEGAQHLFDVPSGLATPTRVDVHRFGPGRGPDSGKVFSPLPRGQPEASTTNQTEILDLMSALRARDNRWRIENESILQGHTYLLSLFQETNRTVIEIRVFEPKAYTNSVCSILPRNGVGSVYYSPRIGSWIHSRESAATRAAPTTEAELGMQCFGGGILQATLGKRLEAPQIA